MSEIERIKKVYDGRSNDKLSKLYLLSLPYIYLSRQEKERALFGLFKKAGLTVFQDLELLEIGCGRGEKIADLLQMGFSSENIIGNDLMPELLEKARRRLPKAVRLIDGDARAVGVKDNSLDLVYQSMVFSSILDSDFQQELASIMWEWVRPGGGILWYDFVYNNPANKDVQGIKIPRVKELFPDADKYIFKRVTLAPPLSRRVTKIHPSLYPMLNTFPFLRSHVVGFIKKRE